MTIERTFDAEHLKAIHRHVFGNVYPWAGEFRTVDMVKSGDIGFASIGDVDEAGSGFVVDYLSEVCDYVTRANWADMSREEFVGYSSTVLAAVNQAHPFREGNGRTQKHFLEHVAELSPFTFNGFEAVDVAAWNNASEASRPREGRLHIEPAALMKVMDLAVSERAVRGTDDQAFQQRVNVLGMQAAISFLGGGTTRNAKDAGDVRETYRGYGQEYGSGSGVER